MGGEDDAGDDDDEEEDEEEGEEEKNWCVLKGFAIGDEKGLQRAVAVLASVKHKHILPLLGVCLRKGLDFGPDTYYLQLPLLPHNLETFCVQREAEERKESLLEREERIGMMIGGVLEAVAHLHQV